MNEPAIGNSERQWLKRKAGEYARRLTVIDADRRGRYRKRTGDPNTFIAVWIVPRVEAAARGPSRVGTDQGGDGAPRPAAHGGRARG